MQVSSRTNRTNAFKRCITTVGDLIPRPLRAFGFHAILKDIDAKISFNIFHSPPHMAFKYFFLCHFVIHIPACLQ